MNDAFYTWYNRHGRHHLPWRNTENAYHILLSEVMLQQTQVKTVLERFYFPFLEKFPTLAALAAADRESVLKQWQGLGYYNRAVNLHKTAQLTANGLPETVEELMELPGIGKNTAHAVAAFAYHQPVPVMEANVKRIIHRFFAQEQLTEKQLWQYAFELLDHSNPFDYNQAMMDIGAMVCTVAQPQCLLCPLAESCKGKHQPHAYLAAKKKKDTPVRQRVIVVFAHKDCDGVIYYHMQPREGRFLHGLYHFSEYTLTQPITFYNQRYDIKNHPLLGEISQTYSHFRLEAKVHQVWVAAIDEKQYWHSGKSIANLPVSGAETKIFSLLNNGGDAQSIEVNACVSA